MAGRLGAKVLLIEWANSVGGISTSGLMSHWTGTVTSPLYTEILTRMAEKNEGRGQGEDCASNQSRESESRISRNARGRGASKSCCIHLSCGVIMDKNRVAGIDHREQIGQTRVFWPRSLSTARATATSRRLPALNTRRGASRTARCSPAR